MRSAPWSLACLPDLCGTSYPITGHSSSQDEIKYVVEAGWFAVQDGNTRNDTVGTLFCFGPVIPNAVGNLLLLLSHTRRN